MCLTEIGQSNSLIFTTGGGSGGRHLAPPPYVVLLARQVHDEDEHDEESQTPHQSSTGLQPPGREEIIMVDRRKLSPKSGLAVILNILEDTARYAGLLLAPAEGFGLRPKICLPFGQKKSLLCCFCPFLAIFGVQ